MPWRASLGLMLASSVPLAVCPIPALLNVPRALLDLIPNVTRQHAFNVPLGILHRVTPANAPYVPLVPSLLLARPHAHHATEDNTRTRDLRCVCRVPPD